jgi:hypothetical protein
VTLARIVPDYEPARRSWVELMAPAIELAKAIAATDFVPRAMRNSPAAISAAILYGDEIGIGPMQSLSKIAVIDGRPFIAAEAQRALVLAAGHSLWIESATNTSVTWCGRRNGTDQVTKITWTDDDARRAHLDGKPNWRSYPRAMLSARASAELVRALFPDVIGGLGALEEQDDLDLPDGAGSNPALGAAPSGTQRRRRAKVADSPAPPTAAASVPTGERPGVPILARPPLPGEVVDEPAPTITRAQSNRLHGLFKRRGMTGRNDRLNLTREVVGRPDLQSSKDLTSADADRLADYLESLPVLDQQALDLEGQGEGEGDQ